MSSIQSNPSMRQPTVTHSVDDPDSNPELEAANQLAIKKATSLPHFTQSSGAMLSREEDIEHERKQRRRVVDQQQYEEALQNVFKGFETLNADSQSPEAQQALKAAQCSGKDLLNQNMKQMALMAANLCLAVFAATADAKCRASKIMTDSQCEIRTAQAKKYQQQLQKQIAAAKKARKMKKICCIIDWAVGVAEAAYGLFKLVEGIAEGIASFGADPNAWTSTIAGAAYLSAGVAGMVKAAAETAELCGADPSVCKKIENVAGWVQLGCELVGLATDIFGAGLAFKAATGVAKGAAEVATRAAEEAVTKAVAEAATQAAEGGAMEMTELGVSTAAKSIEEVAEEVSQEAAEEIGDSIVNKITSEAAQETAQDTSKSVGKKITKAIIKRSMKRIAKHFGEDAMKDMIKQSLKESMEDASKQAEKGVQRSITRIINDMKRKIMRRIMTTCLRVFVSGTVLSVSQGVAAGSSQIVQAENTRQQGIFRAQIDTIVLMIGLLGLMDQEQDESKKEENKQIQDVMNKSATVLQNAKDTIEMFGMTSVKVAINIAK